MGQWQEQPSRKARRERRARSRKAAAGRELNRTRGQRLREQIRFRKMYEQAIQESGPS